MTTKEAVLKLLEALPGDATIKDIRYHLYVLQKIEAGQAAVDAGDVLAHEDVLRQLAGWLVVEKGGPGCLPMTS